jgi:hypothetical protein
MPRANPAPYVTYAAHAAGLYPTTVRFLLGGEISNSCVRRLLVE